MVQKNVTLAILGIIAVVAIVGLVFLLSIAKTGMGIYIQPGQFQRGLAIRSIGSGYQTAVTDISKGTFVTAGESQSPSAQGKHITPRIPGAYEQCMPLDETGSFMYDQNGLILIGWELAKESVSAITIYECTDTYFKDISDPLTDHMCCRSKGYSSLPGSTGSAYYAR